MSKNKFDNELETHIRTIRDSCSNEDKGLYSNQQALLRRNELWYHGLQYIYWDYNAQDWVAPPSFNNVFGDDGSRRGTEDCYDYVVNILKAHGDSFIAALSSEIPSVIFPPADMREPNDISTARAYNKISELIDIHNPIVYLFIKLLFIKWNQGTVGIYHYLDQDESYGINQVPRYQTNEETGEVENVGIAEHPKSRVLLDVFGPINFKIPYYSRVQKDISYLIMNEDQDYTLMQEIYDDDDIRPSSSSEGGRYYRMPSSYTIGLEGGEETNNLVTVQRSWIRPNRYRIIKKSSPRIYSDLVKKYPNGLYTVFVGKDLKELHNEKLDDHWTLSRSGISSHITSDPVCTPILHIQDIENTVTNLSVDILEHSIPETFADTEALAFDQYGKIESAPGYIFKAKIPPGMRGLGDAFFSPPKTQLTPALGQFMEELDSKAQFLIGNNPAVWGGSMGNRVPGEVYNDSRTASLQRWGLSWHEIVDVWKRAKVKSVELFVSAMGDKESFTVNKYSRSITTYIERHEMTGKVGEVEPQSIERFPMSAQEKQQWLMQLMGMKSPEITEFLLDPENREIIAELLSFPGLHVPGTNQRNKQLIEFAKLSTENPISDDTPSVVIDPDIDDDAIHIRVLKVVLADEVGIDLKRNNPKFYLNCILHLKEHVQSLQAKTTKQYGDRPPGYPPHTTSQSTQG